MKIKSISESGSNNILRWAITNGADIRTTHWIHPLINSDLEYVIEVEDVNLFEYFRLLQECRGSINGKLQSDNMIGYYDIKALAEMFPGTYKDAETNQEIPWVNFVKEACDMAGQIVQQMSVDNDIISPLARDLFLPMLTHHYDVAISVNATALICGLTDDEYKNIFNSSYPESLNTVLNDPNSTICQGFLLSIAKQTKVINYDSSFEKAIDVVKYSNLKIHDNRLYGLSMLGFSVINKEQTERLTWFNATQKEVTETMDRMEAMWGNNIFEYAITLPIKYMAQLLSIMKVEDMQFAFESSMSSILKTNIINFDSFVLNTTDDEDNDRTTDIAAYHNRIDQLNNFILKIIKLMIEDGNIDNPCIFSLLPPIYMTKAVIRVDAAKFCEIRTLRNYPVLGDLINTMQGSILKLLDTMNKK